jgi:hypothetical protein
MESSSLTADSGHGSRRPFFAGFGPVSMLIFRANPLYQLRLSSEEAASRRMEAASLELYKEYPDPQYDEVLAELIPTIKQTILAKFKRGTTCRGSHAKGHAAVRADFIVEGGLPEELSVGIFSKPRTYPAWIRFSNLSITPEHDLQKDVRALAIKLMEVDGEMSWQPEAGAKTMDFIMMGSPRFLTPNLSSFTKFQKALCAGGLTLFWYLMTHPKTLWIVATSQSTTGSVLEIPYWSQTAFTFGDRAVKYHMQPLTDRITPIPARPSPNYLREEMIRTLKEQSIEFDFMVQFQADPYKMPIEDPTVRWDPELSPYRKVAKVRVLRQSNIDSLERQIFCENLSFNCGRTLPEHRPMGDINRARLAIYDAIAAFRRHRNNADPTEPTPEFNP